MTNDAQTTSSCCSTTSAQQVPESLPMASSCCGGSAKQQTPTAADTTTCPVMVGTPVVKAVAEAQGLFRDFEGQRYWFCCASCGPAFDSDPAKYAANMA